MFFGWFSMARRRSITHKMRESKHWFYRTVRYALYMFALSLILLVVVTEELLIEWTSITDDTILEIKDEALFTVETDMALIKFMLVQIFAATLSKRGEFQTQNNLNNGLSKSQNSFIFFSMCCAELYVYSYVKTTRLQGLIIRWKWWHQR